jgi:transcriptional regulator with XRE-family HTH domain
MNWVMPNLLPSAAIRAELASRGLFQVDVAKKLGITPGQVGRRMNGEIDWRLDELNAIAEMLDVPVSTLIDAPTAASKAS